MNNQVGLPLLSRMISQVEHSDKGTYGPFVRTRTYEKFYVPPSRC